MYAQRYGTIPVVHATGGLKDSVEQYDPFEGKGTGWKFDRCDAEGVKFGLWHAIDTFKHHKEAWAAMKKRAMSKDFSWATAATGPLNPRSGRPSRARPDRAQPG